MMTDPISDMLTRIRNAQMARQARVVMPWSKLKFQVAEVLRAAHYLGAVSRADVAGRPTLAIDLKYTSAGAPAITNIKRISRPGRRLYSKADELPKVLNNYGLAVVSTSAGLMTNREARKRGLGGEIICEVY